MKKTVKAIAVYTFATLKSAMESAKVTNLFEDTERFSGQINFTFNNVPYEFYINGVKNKTGEKKNKAVFNDYIHLQWDPRGNFPKHLEKNIIESGDIVKFDRLVTSKIYSALHPVMKEKKETEKKIDKKNPVKSIDKKLSKKTGVKIDKKNPAKKIPAKKVPVKK